MLSQDACETILGIRERTVLSAEAMADTLNVTFFPSPPDLQQSEDVAAFIVALRTLFDELHVNVVPYEQALMRVPLSRVVRRFFQLCANNALFVLEYPFKRGKGRFFITPAVMSRILRRTKIKSGISVIMTGEYDDGSLPIDHVSSFRKSSVIAIMDMPGHITAETDFFQHFDTAMESFAHHMANIVILVQGTEWVLYNFNASHPRYDRAKHFREDVLHGLIPKIVAPIRPLRFQDMVYVRETFDPTDAHHKPFTTDLVENSRLLESTGLYPPGKKLTDLPFRSDFYRWIGAIHLDQRSGMSYGFLARQMPTTLPELIPDSELKTRFGAQMNEQRDFFWVGDDLYAILQLPQGRFGIRVPEVWVLSQRSGSNKTHMDPQRDLVKLGLKNGNMYIQAPRGLTLASDYRPSFDTGAILAHAVGNAIVASILHHFNAQDRFAAQIATEGAALVHWHGYVDPMKLPDGWVIYGANNPNVSCSSPQASLYALQGKFERFNESFTGGRPYYGDIHIEPHHGSNMSHASIKSIAELFLSDPSIATLGNKYLDAYAEQ